MIVQQTGLFGDAEPKPKRSRGSGPSIITIVDGERMGGQCARILALLRLQPQLNSTLATVSLKYTSRLSDLRAAGYTIKCERIGRDGLTKYYLVGEPVRGAK